MKNSKFAYHSEQVHSSFHNGKGQTKVNVVNIRNGKGTKSVTMRNKRGAIVDKSTKPLTQKEIDCIRNCQFIPGLFRDCMNVQSVRKRRMQTRRNTRRSRTQE